VTAPNPDRPDRPYGYAGYPERPASPPSSRSRLADAGLRARASRPRRHGRRWFVALVVLAGLLVAADRVGAVVAESEMASQIQNGQKLAQKPGASISGIPFLTQVISRDFGHVTLDIRGLVASGVPLSDIHADLSGVHVSSGFNSATVDRLTAVAFLDYSDLSAAVTRQAGIGTVTVADGGAGQLKASYAVLGVAATAQIHISLLAGNELEVKSGKIDTPLPGLGTPPGFDQKVPLGTLPFGIRFTSLVVAPSAVEITAYGRNVSLSQTTASGQ
jgi:hypothetical protein